MIVNAGLIETFMEPCTMMDKARRPDGAGGFTIEWTDGARFEAAIIKDQTLAARVAEKQGVTELYTVTTGRDVGLDFHEVFRREADGAIFRVTANSADSKTPAAASFAFEQVTAERWELT